MTVVPILTFLGVVVAMAIKPSDLNALLQVGDLSYEENHSYQGHSEMPYTLPRGKRGDQDQPQDCGLSSRMSFTSDEHERWVQNKPTYIAYTDYENTKGDTRSGVVRMTPKTYETKRSPVESTEEGMVAQLDFKPDQTTNVILKMGVEELQTALQQWKDQLASCYSDGNLDIRCCRDAKHRYEDIPLVVANTNNQDVTGQTRKAVGDDPQNQKPKKASMMTDGTRAFGKSAGWAGS